MLAARKFIKK